jgi:hypothetical protein
LIRGIEPDPEAVTPSRRPVAAEQGQDKADESGRGRGQHQPRRAAEGAAGDGLQRGHGVALQVGELERLVGAHETGQEGEDGHADPALERHPDDGQLQQARAGGVNGVFGPEE